MVMRFVTWTIAVLGLAGMMFLTDPRNISSGDADSPATGGDSGATTSSSTPPHYPDKPVG